MPDSPPKPQPRDVHCLQCAAYAMLFRTLLASRRSGTPDPLSEREIDCLLLSAEGWTAGAIAVALGVSERTANFHIGNAIDKLGAANKAHAVALALRRGLME